ncbi:hypothetical protein ACWGBH_15210 [Streptomyces massasporeus]
MTRGLGPLTAVVDLAGELIRRPSRAGALRGGLAVLLDADEHTGGFGGARAHLAGPDAVRPAGAAGRRGHPPATAWPASACRTRDCTAWTHRCTWRICPWCTPSTGGPPSTC